MTKRNQFLVWVAFVVLAPFLAGNRVANRSSFTLGSVANCKLWLKADAEAFANNDPVGTATDYSGQGNNATGSGSARPTFKTGGANGKSYFQFDGSDDAMAVSTVSAQDFTFFVVVKMASTAGFVFDGASGNRAALGDGLNGTGNNFGIYAGTAVAESAFTVSGSAVTLWSGTFNGASSVLRKNGASFASGSVGTQGLDSGMIIGNRFALSFYASMDLYEIFIVSGTPSTPTVQQIEDALGAKYGLTISH